MQRNWFNCLLLCVAWKSIFYHIYLRQEAMVIYISAESGSEKIVFARVKLRTARCLRYSNVSLRLANIPFSEFIVESDLFLFAFNFFRHRYVKRLCAHEIDYTFRWNVKSPCQLLSLYVLGVHFLYLIQVDWWVGKSWMRENDVKKYIRLHCNDVNQ